LYWLEQTGWARPWKRRRRSSYLAVSITGFEQSVQSMRGFCLIDLCRKNGEVTYPIP